MNKLRTQKIIQLESLLTSRFLALGFLLIASVLSANVFSHDYPPELAAPAGNFADKWLGFLIVILLILQTLLIIGLQKSRLNNKRAKLSLKEAQKKLEARINERSESLHKINDLLIDEVARHEATGFLLRETKEYLQSIINSMPSIIIGVDTETRVTHWNAAAENNFEIFSNDALGKNIASLLPQFPVNAAAINKIIREGEPRSSEHAQSDSEGQKRYFEITVYPLISIAKAGAVIRMDDVTLRVTIENLMIQNEKMYSLGEVAAGIAHEINNPLSVILQNVQNITRRLDPAFSGNEQSANQFSINLSQLDSYLKDREIYLFLNSIRDAGERSAHIVTNMLSFTHSAQHINSWVNIATLLEQAIALNSNLYAHKAADQALQMHIDIEPNLPLINGSGPELQQVFLNLLRNAKQAFNKYEPPNEPPSIWLSVKRQKMFIVIEIQDNGPGMTENVSRHIFEPFFTTKSVGSGTGLGLSIAYFIITERHQGSIQVKSTPNKGSTFTISLPIEANSTL